MSFVAPLMLIGVLGAAVPLLVHLIGKRRAPRRRFAAIDFVLRSNRRLARSLVIRQWVLLALRMALVAGMAVMMAKPFFLTESDLPALGGGAQSAVIVLDDTMSMRWKDSDGSLIERAKKRAAHLVGVLGARADIAVISVSKPAGPLPKLTRDSRRVRAAIASLDATYRHARLAPALTQAQLSLRRSTLQGRHIFVISDMARHGETTQSKLPAGIAVHYVDVAKGKSLANRAVVSLTAASSHAPGQHATRIEANICNYSARASRVRATLAIDGAEVARGLVNLEAFGCQTKRFEHSFSRGGAHDAVVSIEDDALDVDNRRYLRVEVEVDIKVLIVNGSPSPLRHRDELFYLSAAYASGGEGQAITPRVTTADDLERVRIDAHDLVVLANVRELPRKHVAELEAFVARGGGLLITMGDQISPRHLNRSLAKLLPQPLRGVTATTPDRSGRSALRIGRVDTEHPVVHAFFDERTGGGLRQARFYRVVRLRPRPGSSADARRVVASYDDGSPALVERRIGSGRVLLYTSTIDRDWNDLPIRPGYLPLMQQIARYLGRALDRAPRPPILVGARQRVAVMPSKQHRVSDPSGAETLWSIADVKRRKHLAIEVSRPGFYRVAVQGADRVWRPLERETFASNVDPAESDLRRAAADPAALVASAPKGTVRRAKRKVELWHGVGAFLLAFLLVESILTRRG
ncbi:MAG: BatA domain-containing protein [Myxococcales bacterium]|nr:BatA domain-containing protein [Myxococcales bacterium]